MNSIHKNSQNTITEKYLSTQFNASSRNISNDKLTCPSSKQVPHFSRIPSKNHLQSLSLTNKNHLLFSQKYLDVHQNKEFLMMKEKRVKSQVQMQNADSTVNFTSINKDGRALKENIQMQTPFEGEGGDSQKLKSIQSYYDQKTSGSKQGTAAEVTEEEGSHFPMKHFVYDEDPFVDSNPQNNHFKIDKSLRINNEEFFEEASGNIYCRKLEEYCLDCLEMLKKIKRGCEECGKKREGFHEGTASSNSKMSFHSARRTETCLNCWNKLTGYSESCTNCNDEPEMRSRNITFANKILIKKKKDEREIGLTMVDFDNKLDSESEEERRGSQKRRQKGGRMAESKLVAGDRELREKWNLERKSGGDLAKKRNLDILLPKEGFSVEDSGQKGRKAEKPFK